MLTPYRWIAEYKDGTFYEEPEDGKSKTVPYDPVTDFQPSAFRDINHTLLKKFWLYGTTPDNMTERWSIDLTTGVFEHNGTEFIIHPQAYVPEACVLVFFREVRREHDYQTTVMPDRSLDVEEKESRHYINRTFFGFKENKFDADEKPHAQIFTIGIV